MTLAQQLKIISFSFHFTPAFGAGFCYDRFLETIARERGRQMEFEVGQSRGTQLIALLLTLLVVGAGVMWAVTAA